MATGASIPTSVLLVDAEPSDRTPFPYTIVAAWLQRGSFSVTSVVSGQPPDEGWEAIAERTAVDALMALEAG